MSATSRRHRRSAGSYKAANALRQAADQPAVSLGITGPYEVVMQGPVMFLVACPLPGMAPELADAIRLRRDATLTGQCAGCGGRRHHGRTHGRAAYFLHDEQCPAGDRAIDGLVERTGWTGAA